MPKKTGLGFALSDPKRARICKTVAAMGRASPRELADELSLQLGDVAYHVRVLAKSNALKLVDELPRRGAVKHVYELSIKEPWALTELGLAQNETDL
jgi:hypothetical protein